MQNTVLATAVRNADIVGIVKAENRITQRLLNEQVIGETKRSNSLRA